MTAPISVTIVLPDLAGGGAQRVMLALAGGLDRKLFRPRLVVLGGSRAFAGHIPADVETTIGSAKRLRSGLPWLIRDLNAHCPAIIVSVMGYLNLALLGARPFLPRGVRIVVREANTVASTTAALPSWLPSRHLYRQLYATADAIVSPTRSIAGEIAALSPAAARCIHVVANPVDVDGLRGRAITPCREPGPGLRLVAAGRLSRQKGFDRLIELLPVLPDGAHISVFGTGAEENALVLSAKRLGQSRRIAFRGFTDDLAAWIAGADAFLLPSRWEGLPNVVLESLALGTPVIASPESGVTEIAEETAPKAMRVADVSKGFAAAIAETASTPGISAPRPRLLPDRYLSASVMCEWAALLQRLVPARSAVV